MGAVVVMGELLVVGCAPTVAFPAPDRQCPVAPGSDRTRENAAGTGRMAAVNEDNLLGDHLRARRELVRPDEVGLLVHDTRRVAGLRRDYPEVGWHGFADWAAVQDWPALLSPGTTVSSH